MAFAFCCVALSAWEIDKTPDGAVFRNDSKEIADVRKATVIPLIGEGTWIRKNFDLSALKENGVFDFQSVSLRLFCMVADQSVAVKKIARNGFTEKLALRVNGHEMVLDTADKRLPHSRQWAEIEFPLEWLKSDKGLAVVELHKVKSATNDDFVYVAMDTDADNASSTISVDGGKVFKKESKFFSGFKGELRMRLVFRAHLQEINLDFSKPGDIEKIEYGKGISHKDGMISLDGAPNKLADYKPMEMIKVAEPGTQAKVRNSQGMNIRESGFTFTAVVRQRSGTLKDNDNAIVACKPGVWFFGRTGNMFNMSFCVNQANGVNWNKAVVEGAFPETGQWCHLAFTFERVNEKAQGNVGYYANIYCNGELQARKFFLYAEPICTDEPVFLGNGTVGDYGFCGDIASAAMYMRTLSEAEIAKMASLSPQVKALPEGQHEIGEPLKTALADALKNAKGASAKWLLSCLERAAATGYDQKIIADLCKNGALKQDLDLEKLAQEWNKAQNHFRLLVAEGHGLFMALGKVHGISPVIGIFDSIGKREITGMRPLGWSLRHGGRRVRNYDGDVALEVSDPIKQDVAYVFNAVWKKPGAFTCTSRIRFSGARTEMDLQVENLDAGRLLGTVEFPQFSITKLPGKNDQLVFPLFSGVLYKSPTTALGVSGNYPSARSAMQFIGYFDESGNGVYAALEGTDGAFRTHSVNGRNGTLRYEWSNNVPYEAGAKGGNSWKSPGVAVLQSYRGDWFEAGQIYKDFLSKKADWFVKELPRKDTPKWYRDNTFWLAG
ncbi:MAG: LamG domain-containing protein, partial [Victivallales bacterium]|nr:LamG domain-containing protein [Victivallales bacterium]